MADLKMLLAMYALYARMDLLWTLRDTRYFILQSVADAVTAVCTISAVYLVASRFGVLGDMTGQQILFMLGYATAVAGVYALFFSNNNAGQISRTIARGQIDHSLLQPVALPIQFMTQGFAPFSGSSRLVCGLLILVMAGRRLPMSLTPASVVGLTVSIVLSAIIMGTFVYAVSTVAFYAPAATEEIAEPMVDLFTSSSVYPLGGLNGVWKLIFCSLIPVGLSGWFPVKVMLDQGNGFVTAVLVLTAASALSLLVSASLFRKGLRHYAQYGCSRYSGFGHR